MFRAIFLLVSVFALASHVAAVTLNVTGMNVPTISLAQLLQVPTGAYTTACQSNCSAVNSTIIACNDVDSCLCTQDIVTQLTDCEQCMFNTLVALNEKAPDTRVGSNVLLGQLPAACNTTFPGTGALVIAPTWDGPTDIILNTPETVVVVGFGAIMAGTFLMMFSTI